MVVLICNSSSWEINVGGSQSEASPRQKYEILTKKITKAKRAKGMDQVVELLPSLQIPECSNPNTII
jgi:hypothetical protein